MQLIAVVPLFIAALASAQDSSSGSPVVSNDNPFTSFLTETDSNGVVTGQPTVVLTQPGAVTTQPLVATIPNGLPSGINTVPIDTTTTIIVSVGDGTTAVLGPSSSDAATSSEGGEEGASETESAAETSSTGGAVRAKVAGGALVGAGAFVFAML